VVFGVVFFVMMLDVMMMRSWLGSCTGSCACRSRRGRGLFWQRLGAGAEGKTGDREGRQHHTLHLFTFLGRAQPRPPL